MRARSVVSESVLEKAHRLLVEGRLEVTSRDRFTILATCQGDTGIHQLGSKNGIGRCSCPATGVCSHLLALSIVTGNPPAIATEGDESV